jgi:hypothetical protein
MVYGRWLDFYMHVVWRSRTNGILQIWYRVEVSSSSQSSTRTSWRRRAHPGTPASDLLYNTENGALGENGKPGPELERGFYRANTAWTNEYWWGWDEALAERGGDPGGVPEQTHATGPNAAAARSAGTCTFSGPTAACTFSAPTGENRPPNPRAR